MSFEEMLTTEDAQQLLPGLAAVEDGVEVYREFYKEKDEHAVGVIALTLQMLPCDVIEPSLWDRAQIVFTTSEKMESHLLFDAQWNHRRRNSDQVSD